MISLKLETLLSGKVVEQSRIEYKEGWNPNEVIHTICAFANDIHNMNGGYIVLGLAAKEGIPVLPSEGIPLEKLDIVQQEIFQYCNQIIPRYIPRIEVVNYQDTGVYYIYLWCPAGDSGPYQAPKEVFSNNKSADKRYFYWIRPASLTTIAKQKEIADLFDKFNSIPFDDRINRTAALADIQRGYVEDFLRTSNSSLVEELNQKSLEELLLALEVANETDAGLDIRNIGILMFSEKPHKLIPGAQIDLVMFHSIEAEASDDFLEKSFQGPIWKQIKAALDFIKTNIIIEKVVKVENQEEAKRFYNYPFNAIEEALVNAVFHKSYREAEPVEIRVYVDSIQIINYPGLDRWIDVNKFTSGRVKARKYRNRRIGEFLKEIDLTEKQGTGIPKILRELRLNGSAAPEFDMDKERTYLNTIFHIRDGFTLSGKMSDKVIDKLSDKERVMFENFKALFIQFGYVTTKDFAEKAGVSLPTARRYLNSFHKFKIIKISGGNKNRKFYPV